MISSGRVDNALHVHHMYPSFHRDGGGNRRTRKRCPPYELEFSSTAMTMRTKCARERTPIFSMTRAR